MAWHLATLDAETLTLLDGVGLRRARAVTTAALAEALEAGRDWPSAGDFRTAVALLGGEATRPRRRRRGLHPLLTGPARIAETTLEGAHCPTS